MGEMTDIIEKELWATIVWKVMPTTNPDTGEGRVRLNNIKTKLDKECKQYLALSIGKMLKQSTTDIYPGSSEELLAEIVSKAKKVDEEFRSNESMNNDMKKIEVVSATQEEVEKSNLEPNNPDVFKCEKCKEITDHSRMNQQGIGELWQCETCGHKTTKGRAVRLMPATEDGIPMLATIMAEVIFPTDPESEEGMARLDNISIQLRKELVDCEMLAVAKKLSIKLNESYLKSLEELVRQAKNIDKNFQSGKDSFASSEKSDSSRPKGKGCYIATACYGSYTHPDVQTFRIFRDNVLMHSIPGRLFVLVYYKVSPPLARRIGKVRWLAAGVRRYFLQPIAHHLRKKNN